MILLNIFTMKKILLETQRFQMCIRDSVNTECQISFAEATRKYIEEGKDQQGKGFDPRKLLAPGFEAIKATVKEKMELFGSIDKA